MIQIIMFDAEKFGIIGGLSVYCQNKETGKLCCKTSNIRSESRQLEIAEDYCSTHKDAKIFKVLNKGEFNAVETIQVK